MTLYGIDTHLPQPGLSELRAQVRGVAALALWLHGAGA
jgi:hypothetical protein